MPCTCLTQVCFACAHTCLHAGPNTCLTTSLGTCLNACLSTCLCSSTNKKSVQMSIHADTFFVFSKSTCMSIYTRLPACPHACLYTCLMHMPNAHASCTCLMHTPHAHTHAYIHVCSHVHTISVHMSMHVSMHSSVHTSAHSQARRTPDPRRRPVRVSLHVHKFSRCEDGAPSQVHHPRHVVGHAVVLPGSLR